MFCLMLKYTYNSEIRRLCEMIGWIILIIAIILILFVVGIYNNLVSLRLRVKNAWAQIDTQLKRRFDLIPNLVETVKGYAKHEQDTLEKVIEARNKFTAGGTVNDVANASAELSNCLKSIFALAESYPDLKANENFNSLQVELTGTEDKIAYARQFYNDTVQKYNEAIAIFPNSIIANIFKFNEEQFFQVTKEEEKEPVKVQF